VRTSRGFDRLVSFSDAVVTIAMTLLVLPLADLPTQPHDSVGELLSDNRGVLVGFLLSFVVIARLWLAHHRVTEYLDSYDAALLRLTLLWLLTIVFLPFPTALVGSEGGAHRGVAALYIGTLLVNTLCLEGVTALARRRPELQREGLTADDLEQLGQGNWWTSAMLALALLLAVFLPGVGLLGLLLLFFESQARAALTGLFRRPRRAPG
jgi:uncharacterized membrane protein